MMSGIKKSQNGFTIIELMIATLIFTLVLLVCSYAIVHVGRVYYKGVVTNRTQDLARKVLDDVAQTIQFGPSLGTAPIEQTAGYPTASPTLVVKSLCLGNVRYSYVDPYTSSAGSTSRYFLWRDTTSSPGTCLPLDLSLANPATTTNAFSTSPGVDLLGNNYIPRFDVDSGDGVWTVNIRVVFGASGEEFVNGGAPIAAPDGDNFPFQYCKGANTGGQFCAVSNINTTIVRRLTE